MTFNLRNNSILILIVTLSILSTNVQARKKIDYLLEAETLYQQVKETSVINSAPVEMKFIEEKLELARQAKADRDKKRLKQLAEQIKADIKIAKMRAKVNELNNSLLNKREQISETQMHIAELEGQLQ